MAAGVAVTGENTDGSGSAGSRPVRGRRLVLILWLALLVEGAIFALAQPPWSPVDEAQHYHYVQSLAQARALPVMGQSFISAEAVGVATVTGRWGWRPQGAAWPPAQVEPEGWTGLPAGLVEQERERWLRDNVWRFSYEAMQPPLYYAINAPALSVLPGGSLVKVYGLRLLAVLMASAMVPLAWLTAREVYPLSRLAVYGAPAAVLLVQGYALNLSQVTNDALAAPLAAAALLALVRLVGRGLGFGRSLATGVLVGLSLLTKMTTVFLVPAILIAFTLLAFSRRETPGRLARHLLLVSAPVALLVAPWLIRNLYVYGDLSGAIPAASLLGPIFSFDTVSLEGLRLDELWPTFWFGEPYGTLAYWRYAWPAVELATALAIGGLLVQLFGRRQRPEGDAGSRSAFLMLAVVAGLATILLLPFVSGISGTPGRYFYPLLPAIACLMLFAIERLPGRRWMGLAAGLLAGWLSFWEMLNLADYLWTG